MRTLLDRKTAERFTEKELKTVLEYVERFKSPVTYSLGFYEIHDRLGWFYPDSYTSKKDLLQAMRWSIKNCKPVEW